MEAAGQRWVVHPSRADTFTIWNLADLHIINAACAMSDIERDVQAIANDPYALWLGGGDYCDFIGYQDKRFDPDSIADWVNVSDLSRLGEVGYRRVRDLLYPIRDKCLGLLLGNHEKKYMLHREQADRQTWLCTELELPTRGNLGYSALFDVIFVRQPGTKPHLQWEPARGRSRQTQCTIRIYAHHGCGFAKTPGGKLKTVLEFLDNFTADLYFCGHVHDRVGKRKPKLGANSDCSRITEEDRVGLISGGYLKTYAQGTCTYGEQRGYSPTSLGAACATVEPESGIVRGTV